MRVAYVRWHDAHFTLDETPLDDLGAEPCELHEFGWLLNETTSHVTLGVEWQDGADTARNTLTIPRVNIREFLIGDHEDLLPKMKRSPVKSRKRRKP